MILLIDNYDSFTFNVQQVFARTGAEVLVKRNDSLSLADVRELAPDAVVVGPGPGRPDGAGISLELFAELPGELPLLGVCLGHQALVQHYGGSLEEDPEPVHGRATRVYHDGSPPFDDLPNPFLAGRYHSLRVGAGALPSELRRSAWTESGEVMGVVHRELPRFGVQFHPESILTPDGDRLVESFVEVARGARSAR